MASAYFRQPLGRHEDVMMVEPLGVPEVRLLFKVRRGWISIGGAPAEWATKFSRFRPIRTLSELDGTE